MNEKSFFIIFGSFWTFITGIITVAMYSAPTVTVNDVPVSQEEFSQMLWPKLMLALFWTIGLAFLIIGIYRIVKDKLTSVSGEECHGRITDIRETNVTLNGYPILEATVLVYVPSLNETKEVTEKIGTNWNKYPVDSIVKVKYNKNDIVIIGKEDESVLTLFEIDELGVRNNSVITNEGIIDTNITAEDVIEVNGVKYKKMD